MLGINLICEKLNPQFVLPIRHFMKRSDRRTFLKDLTLGLGAGLLLRGHISAKNDLGPYRFLVVGDSLVWGQGLSESDKFYSLTAQWLRKDHFHGDRRVDLKVKAHSGSTIKLHDDEVQGLQKLGRSESEYFHPEVNVGFPSIWKQVELAADEYKSEGAESGADLVMVTGGITDITVAKVLDPFGKLKDLPPLIDKYCRDDMLELIEKIAAGNPRALIVVAGYSAMISPQTKGSAAFNGWLETLDIRGAWKPIVNNALSRTLFFNRLKKKATVRSRFWVAESNKALSEAVARFNAKGLGAKAIFVASPIDEAHALETPDSWLFKIGKKGTTPDPMYAERQKPCQEAIPYVNKALKVKYSLRKCEVAAIGHPNEIGAREYARVITDALSRTFSSVS